MNAAKFQRERVPDPEDSPINHETTNKTNKKLLVVVLAVGFVIGYSVATMGSNRYILKDSGLQGGSYKMDTRSGQLWLVTPSGETLLK